MNITYGLAEYDRYSATVSFDVHLPMDGVIGSGGLVEFLESAGKAGWQLCSSYPSSVKGNKRILTGYGDKDRISEDATEQILSSS